MNFNKEKLPKLEIETKSRINTRPLLDRVEIDGDRKEYICVTPDGVVERLDWSAMPLDEVYQVVEQRAPEGLGNIKPTKNIDDNRVK